jgi:ribosomal protein L19E
MRESKDRQRAMGKRKGTNNDLLNTTQRTKVRATRTTLKTGGERRCSGRVGSHCSTSATRHVTKFSFNFSLFGKY